MGGGGGGVPFDHSHFFKTFIGMKIVIKEDIYYRCVIIFIQTDNNNKRQSQSFKQRRKNDWYRLGSIEQEENKHKNGFNR